MDPRCTLVGERTGHAHGIVAVHSGLVVIALLQPHHSPIEQIDGRVQLDPPAHAAPPATRTKLASNANPSRPDFSGWNCVANTVPRRNAAFTVPP